MTTATIGWELYRSFLGVLTEGSLSGAARALGVTQPTIGRHIEALEKTLGIVLFTRSQTGLLPTPAAVSLRIAMPRRCRATRPHWSAPPAARVATASSRAPCASVAAM